MARLFFDVAGTPAPQGSKKGFAIAKGKGAAKVYTGKVAMVESSAKVKPWRQDVKHAACLALADRTPVLFHPWDNTRPMLVTITFRLTRPKSHFGTGKNAGTLKPSAPAHPAVRPDLDKLTRSTLDALTESGAVADDSRVVQLSVRKVYVTDHRPAGAFIELQAAE